MDGDGCNVSKGFYYGNQMMKKMREAKEKFTISQKKAAKEYAGFKESVDPNDSDERYFRSHDCKVYDAFLAGVEFAKKERFYSEGEIKGFGAYILKAANSISNHKMMKKEEAQNTINELLDNFLNHPDTPDFIENMFSKNNKK